MDHRTSNAATLFSSTTPGGKPTAETRQGFSHSFRYFQLISLGHPVHVEVYSAIYRDWPNIVESFGRYVINFAGARSHRSSQALKFDPVRFIDERYPPNPFISLCHPTHCPDMRELAGEHIFFIESNTGWFKIYAHLWFAYNEIYLLRKLRGSSWGRALCSLGTSRHRQNMTNISSHSVRQGSVFHSFMTLTYEPYYKGSVDGGGTPGLITSNGCCARSLIMAFGKVSRPGS